MGMKGVSAEQGVEKTFLGVPGQQRLCKDVEGWWGMKGLGFKDNEVSLPTAAIMSNGKCSACREKIIRQDRQLDDFFFLPIEGLRMRKMDKQYVIQCPGCRRFITLQP